LDRANEKSKQKSGKSKKNSQKLKHKIGEIQRIKNFPDSFENPGNPNKNCFLFGFPGFFIWISHLTLGKAFFQRKFIFPAQEKTFVLFGFPNFF
jgi:hypothetical protein